MSNNKRKVGGFGGNYNNGNNNSNGFKALGLSDPVHNGIVRMGFRNPTPVQRKSIPVIMTGQDTVVMARTGSGKTCAFLIPLFEKLLSISSATTTAQQQQTPGSSSSIRGIILSPTRELSNQTLQVWNKLTSTYRRRGGNDNDGSDANVRAVGIHGGASMEGQFAALASRPAVVVATPGRWAHLLEEIPDLELKSCGTCILDEADRLLEMGFVLQINQIASKLPSSSNVSGGGGSCCCQKVLLSATMPKQLMEFTRSGHFVVDPVAVRLDHEATLSADLRVAFITMKSMEKDAALLAVMECIYYHHHRQRQQQGEGGGDEDDDDESSGGGDNPRGRRQRQQERPSLVLIFVATRHHVEYVSNLLRASGIVKKNSQIGNNNRSGAGRDDEDAGVTQLYGSLDPAARNANLAKFKSGRVPVMVVTDVAARGVDIPLIDHVIHYHAADTAKLFVHRSGRAARGGSGGSSSGGRVGYAWSLVQPDEVPYMMDVHVFLGRKPTSSADEEESAGEQDEKKTDTKSSNVPSRRNVLSYPMKEMTPDHVHYGSVPESILVPAVENVQRMIDSELSSSCPYAESLRSLTKVCSNAMKQYRKTRPEASKRAVGRAKALLEGLAPEEETSSSGGGGGKKRNNNIIPPHPLLRHMELEQRRQRTSRRSDDDGDCTGQEDDELLLLERRQDFLRALSNVRPKETVFEAFCSAGGKKALGVASHVDKGRTVSNNSAKNKQQQDSSSGLAALTAMRNMRRQMRMVRDQGAELVVAGSDTAKKKKRDTDDDKDQHRQVDNSSSRMQQDAESKEDEDEQEDIRLGRSSSEPTGLLRSPVVQVEAKRRISKAERKRMKKNGTTGVNPTNDGSGAASTKENKRLKRDYRDAKYYMENDATSNAEEANRSRQIEAAMQPSAAAGGTAAASASTTAAALKTMQDAVLDIVGDESDQLVQKQRMIRWDKSKRKYVKAVVGTQDLLAGNAKKRLRLESGRAVKTGGNRDANDKKNVVGELYEKWQKKTNLSIGRLGVFDDDYDAAGAPSTGKKKKTNKGGNSGGGGAALDERAKSSREIQKERAKKLDNKIKNMKKADRRKYLQKQQKNHQQRQKK